VRMRQNNIIQISYSSPNAQETQLVTQALTDILMERNIAAQTKETAVAIQFIQEQLGIYKRKIKESEIADLQGQLKTLLVDSTEMHPLVKELRQKLAIAETELDSGEYEVSGTEKPLAEATRVALKKELDTIINKETQDSFASTTYSAGEAGNVPNKSIYNLLLMDKVGTSLAQDIDVNKDIYQMLLQRLETAKITQRLEASKEGTRYTIIDPPRLPLKPTKPNKPQIILFGLFLGCASGAGLVFGREFMDHSFLDIEEAKQNLDLPVLGAISRITTQEEIDKEKISHRRLIVYSLALSLVLIAIVILYSFIRK
jgi:succinoglycan biosynthesis transport protein ExoP